MHRSALIILSWNERTDLSATDRIERRPQRAALVGIDHLHESNLPAKPELELRVAGAILRSEPVLPCIVEDRAQTTNFLARYARSPVDDHPRHSPMAELCLSTRVFFSLTTNPSSCAMWRIRASR